MLDHEMSMAATRPSDLKLNNRMQILELFKSGAVYSVADLARAVGISRQTVMKAIQFFLEKGIIVSDGKADSGSMGGKRAELFTLSGKKYLLNVLIVAVICALMYIYLNYSKHGYEIAVVGESERTARYIGIKAEKVILRTMLLSGAICGIAGVLLVGSTNHTLTPNIVDGRGFTAVMVSWLAKFNPIWMIMTSFLLVFLGRGAGEIATNFGLNQSFGDILTGIILFFIIGSEFFINYQVRFRKSAEKEV